jgi:hypothetical protein
MKAYREEQRHSSSLTLALDGRQWPTSCPGQFNAGKVSWYSLIECWVCPQDSLGIVENRKIFRIRIRTPDHPSHRTDSILTMLPSLAKCHPRTGHDVLPLTTLPLNGNPVYLYALMCNYRSKYSSVKFNSALKDTVTDLSIGIQTWRSSCAINGTEETCWSPSIWCQKPLHPYIPQKNVKDPWPAPYQNSNYYWRFTYYQKTSGSNFLQTSVIFTVPTECYSKGPCKEGEPQTKPRCCIHCPTTLNPSLVGESIGLFNDVSSRLLTESKKIPTLLHHQEWVHSLSFPSLQIQRQILQLLHRRKLNSTTQFSNRCGVTGPKKFYQLPYTPIREKYNKLCNMCQLILPLVDVMSSKAGGPLRLTMTAHCYIRGLNCCPNGYSNQVHWLPLSSTKAMVTYKSVFNPLLRRPAQTHALQFNCLPPLHFQLSFLNTYTFWTH